MDWPWLKDLTPEEQRSLLAGSVPRHYARGDILFHAGDSGDTLHMLVLGRVAIQAVTPLGDTATFAVLGPGDVFGELALLANDHRRSSTAVALEKVETLTLRRDLLEQPRAGDRGLHRFLLTVLAERVLRLSDHLVEALYTPVDRRVVRRLLVLCRQYEAPAEATVTIPLTQADLAGLAGATRPTVNQVLRELERNGAVRLTRGRIEVLDRRLLMRRAR